MSARNIKPCPFCGSMDVKVESMGSSYHTVVCRNCHAVGPNHNDKGKAITRWNQRQGTLF